MTTATTLLPPGVSAALMRAAQTPVTDSDPLARQRAIEEVNRKARLRHPEYFREEDFDGPNDRSE